MDATDELRHAHDVLAEVYAERLAGLVEAMPIERSVFGLFAEMVHDQCDGSRTPVVGDIGCGTGRLAPHLTGLGLRPRGVDLSPEMIRVARRDQPGVDFQVADLRDLPFDDASLDGVVCWYSLMYLPPADRAGAYAELARVVRPGGYLAAAFKVGDDRHRRGGKTMKLGIEFDIYWHSHDTIATLLTDAGFEVTFWAGRPAEGNEPQPQGYVIAQRRAS